MAKNTSDNISNDNSVIWRITIGIILFLAAGLVIDHEPFTSLTYLSAVVLAGYDTALSAVMLLTKRFFDDKVISVIASVAAFVFGFHSEAVAIILFFRVTEYMRLSALAKCRDTVVSLDSICPAHANISRCDTFETVNPSSVEPGDTIVVKSGERVPLDAVVVEGESFMDTRLFTGESMPRPVKPGSEILSGSVNAGSPIYAKVTRRYEESTAKMILELKENISTNASGAESFSLLMSRILPPVLMLLAVSVMVFPSIVYGFCGGEYVRRGLVPLALAGTAAISSSVTVSMFTAVGKAVRNGILIKNFKFIEILSGLKTVVFGASSLIHDGNEYSDSIVAVSGMNARGINTIMLANELKENVKKYADHMGINKLYAGLSVSAAEGRMRHIMKSEPRKCAYIGKAGQEASMHLADIGIALGEFNSADAIAAADVTFMTNEPSKLSTAIKISKHCTKRIKSSIAVLLAVKIAVIILGLTGTLGLWLSVFADACITLIITAFASK